MDSWLARAEQLCYEGEEITDSIQLGEGGVVVTTHRVMAFSPKAMGENYRYAERPNVEGVERDDGGDPEWLQRGIKLLLVGAILAVAGWVVDLEGLIGNVSLSGANRVGGLGSVIGLIRGLLDLLASLDDFMLIGGALALAGAVGALGMYLQTRESKLRIAVAGSADLTVPADPWPESDVVGRVRRATAPPETETGGSTDREKTNAGGGTPPDESPDAGGSIGDTFGDDPRA